MTEPRWERDMGAFSEDAHLTADMLSAFMDGAQGKMLKPGKILVHLKHWPGAALPEKEAQVCLSFIPVRTSIINSFRGKEGWQKVRWLLWAIIAVPI